MKQRRGSYSRFDGARRLGLTMFGMLLLGVPVGPVRARRSTSTVAIISDRSVSSKAAV